MLWYRHIMVEQFVAYGPWGLAAAAFLSGSIAPLPSEAVLVALVALGRGAPAMVAVATAANVLGAATLLWAGRSGRAWSQPRLDGALLERAERQYRRFGPWLLLLSWAPLIGDAFVLAAGAFRVPWRVALPLLTLGKALRYAAVAAGTLWLRGA